jgi:hypothetical protein
MGIALGRDEAAEEVLFNTPTSVRLTMPSICFVESLTTLEQAEKYNQDFLRRLDIQINEAERDKTSENAKLLKTFLEQSKIRFNRRINDTKQRFDRAFNELSVKAEMIVLDTAIFQESRQRNILEKHTIDKIILECIVHHARLHPDEIKVFLSSNSQEFGKQEVTEILQEVNIQYFQTTQNFLSWLQSQYI